MGERAMVWGQGGRSGKAGWGARAGGWVEGGQALWSCECGHFHLNGRRFLFPESPDHTGIFGCSQGNPRTEMASISSQPHSEVRAGLASCPLPSRPTDASAPPDPCPAPRFRCPRLCLCLGGELRWRLYVCECMNLWSVCLRQSRVHAPVCFCTCSNVWTCMDLHVRHGILSLGVSECSWSRVCVFVCGRAPSSICVSFCAHTSFHVPVFPYLSVVNMFLSVL